MKLKIYHVLVQRAAIEVIPCDVFEHELPILQQVHATATPDGGGGPESVQVQSESSREIPDFDVDAEYERLLTKYGKHRETKRPYVEMVYGLKTTGGLHRAIGVEFNPGARPKATIKQKAPAELRAAG